MTIRLTCSGVTGFWDVLCSSSIVFWSKRRSFLQPTRIMGRPWQKCSTSEIHCYAVSQPIMCPRAVHLSYLLLDVVKRVGRVDGEADQDNVRVGVGERAETVVIFLASSIPEGELHVFTINLDVGDVVLKDGGDIDLCSDVSGCIAVHYGVWACVGMSMWKSCDGDAASQLG